MPTAAISTAGYIERGDCDDHRITRGGVTRNNLRPLCAACPLSSIVATVWITIRQIDASHPVQAEEMRVGDRGPGATRATHMRLLLCAPRFVIDPKGSRFFAWHTSLPVTHASLMIEIIQWLNSHFDDRYRSNPSNRPKIASMRCVSTDHNTGPRTHRYQVKSWR